MKKLLLLILSCSLLIISCGKYDNSPLQISSSKTETHDHLGYGIYINPIKGYKKADSYFGYQAPKYQSSLSVKQIYESIEQKKLGFSKSTLSRTKREQLALKDILYEGDKIGFYIVVKNNGAQAISHKLIFEYKSATYQIDAFYPKKEAEKYENAIIDGIASIYFGEEEKEEEFFKLASIGLLDGIHKYSTDGLYPTNNPDSIYLTMQEIDSRDKSRETHFLKIGKTLEKKVNQFSESKYKPRKNLQIEMEGITNAKVYSIYHFNEEQYFHIKHIIPNEGATGQQTILRGNKDGDIDMYLKEMEQFLFSVQIERFN